MNPSRLSKKDLLVLLQDFKEALNHPQKFSSGGKVSEISAKSTLVHLKADSYTEVAPGVWDKVLTDLGNLSNQERKIYYPTIRDYDFDKFHVVLVRFTKGGSFDPHLHPELEIINVVEGSYIDTYNKETFTPGETQVIEPHKAHSFVPLSDGYAAIRLQKT